MNEARPRVVIDARMVGSVGHGIARYVQAIARAIAELEKTEGPLPYELIFLTQSSSISLSQQKTYPVEIPFLSVKELWQLPRVLKKLDAALYHSPSLSSLIVSPCPWVDTVHDLIHLQYGGVAQKLYYRWILKSFFKRAAFKMTVSEASRSTLSSWSGVDPLQIRVVPNVITLPERELYSDGAIHRLLNRLGLERGRYFLSLAPSKPHKNLDFLLKNYQVYRYERMAQGFEPWPLVMTAAGLNRMQGVVSVGGLSDQEVSPLLAGSGGLFFPSLLEGFGIPPLEALLMGVPVIVSRIPAHLEALDGIQTSSIRFLDPQEGRSWTESFHQIDKGEWGAKIQEGNGLEELRQSILNRYSLREMAVRLDHVYRKALESRRV